MKNRQIKKVSIAQQVMKLVKFIIFNKIRQNHIYPREKVINCDSVS